MHKFWSVIANSDDKIEKVDYDKQAADAGTVSGVFKSKSREEP